MSVPHILSVSELTRLLDEAKDDLDVKKNLVRRLAADPSLLEETPDVVLVERALDELVLAEYPDILNRAFRTGSYGVFGMLVGTYATGGAACPMTIAQCRRLEGHLRASRLEAVRDCGEALTDLLRIEGVRWAE